MRTLPRLIFFVPVFILGTLPSPLFAANADVVFVCKGDGVETVTAPPEEERGFFGRIFGFFFREKQPTIVAIDCNEDGALPAPVPTPAVPPEEESGFLGAIRRFIAPQAAPQTSGPNGSKTNINAPTPPPTKEEEIARIEKELALAQKEAEALYREALAYEQIEHRSVYHDKVVVRLTRSRDGNPQNEYFYIHVPAGLPKDTRIPLSSFGIQDGKGEWFKIEGATPLPIPGKKNEKEPIILKPGDTAYVITGYSPNGLSFQLNSCTGYFNRGTRFTPAIPTACPLVSSESWMASLPPECWAFVRSIGRCQTPAIPLGLKPECAEAVAENTTYNACVLNHQHDADFYKNEWRIYLNRNAPIYTDEFDYALIFDENNKWIWYQYFYR